MLELINVSFAYNNELVLNDINLKINDGDFIGLIGDNGSGKTTLLKCLLGLLKTKSGHIHSTFKRPSYLSQISTNMDLVFPANVYEILSLGIKYKPFNFLTKKDKQKIDSILKLLQIEDLKYKQLSELSGGQQQKVRLGKCLLEEPDLLILDEPTSGIDYKSRDIFLTELKKIHQQFKLTIILVSHIQEDLKLVDRILYLKDGKVEEKRC